MTDFIKQLKEQINIADVVGEYVRLRKTGSNHMGLCPFHAERSASFSISEKKGIYHCFGCQRGGDVISFIQEMQGVSFHEAVRILASKFGIKLPAEFSTRSAGRSRPGAEEELEIYYKLNRFVAQFYHENLLSSSGDRARSYLEGRGITEATIKAGYLGYAPSEWGALYAFLEEKKAPIAKAEELGLIRKKSTGPDMSGRAYYDLFRDRIMFPVVDLRGRVIAFGGRSLGDSDGPKYLNSTESPIYNKGSHLYGIFSAQKEIRAEDACVVVEGFMDCLSLQQAGIGFAVATLGTALTGRQIGLLKRFSRNITVLFDGDSAGREAQARAMETFLDEDVVARGVAMPDGYDPDEYVKEYGAAELQKLLKEAPFLLDQQILELAAQSGVHSESRARAVDKVLPWIAKISSDTARLVRLQELSVLFGTPFELLERKIRELRIASEKGTGEKRRTDERPAAGAAVRPIVKPVVRQSPLKTPAEKVDALDVRFVECLIQYPQLFCEIRDRGGILDGFETEAVRGLVSKLFERMSGDSGYSPVADVADSTDSALLKAAIRRALITAERELGKDRTPEEKEALVIEVRDLEKKLARRGLERRKESLRASILKADGSGQSAEVSRLMSEYKELVKRLDETKGGQANI